MIFAFVMMRHFFRGNLPDHGVEIDMDYSQRMQYLRTETDGRLAKPISRRKDRSQSDMFVAQPVPPGIMANRDIYRGTWFIQTIVDVFAQNAHNYDLEDLFKIVSF